jgi:hypothetical protein
MPVVLRLTRIFTMNRSRAEKKLRYMTYGSSAMLVFMMFYFARSQAGEVVPTADMVELSSWRILAGLTFTIMAMGLSEMGSDDEQEFLATIGLRGSTYMWAKWLDLGGRSLPWFLWGLSWGISTASIIPGRPFLSFVGLAITLFVYGLALGGFLGIGVETVLRKVGNGQRTSKGISMFAPFVMVFVMMGMGQNIPVPTALHSLGVATPIRYYVDLLYHGGSGLWAAAGAMATVLPWMACLVLVSVGWSFRRATPGTSLQRAAYRSAEREVRFTSSPFITKDLVMLKRYRLTLFRGVAAAVFLLLPFSFMNLQADMPLFVKFFEVMIVVAASGMMFGLVLPAMDREMLWLIRVTGHLRLYVIQKFGLVSALTFGFSGMIIVPLTFTLELPLAVIIPLTMVGSFLMGSLALIGSGVATRMGVDMVSRPDPNIVMAVMLAFGFYLSTTVLGYMVSWTLFAGFLAMWCVLAAAALGIALFIFETLELA